MNWAALLQAYLGVGVLTVLFSFTRDFRRLGAKVFWADLPLFVSTLHFVRLFSYAVLTWPLFVVFMMRGGHRG